MALQSKMKHSQEEVEKLQTLAGMSELEITNSIAAKAHTILASIIAAAYVLEFVKGARSLGYIIITVIVCVTPYALGWFFYGKDHSTQAVKHTVGIGYALTYCFLLFTAKNDLVFTYVIPMMVIVTLFDDLKYTFKIGSGVVIVNLIDIARKVAGSAEVDSATLEIQGLLTILIVAYLCGLHPQTANSG